MPDGRNTDGLTAGVRKDYLVEYRRGADKNTDEDNRDAPAGRGNQIRRAARIPTKLIQINGSKL